ncbi:MAG TPA: hypothetical protein VFK22_05150 [Candidatus Dormibacteraeota bacterium]|nr:hypothetical protein [Candidatus Dormibacteraeota bacterium]
MLLAIPRFVWMLAMASGVAALFAGADLFITTWSDRGVPAMTITICRATDVPQHPYQAANVRIAPDGSLPRDVDPARDVVPPYSYSGTDYAGVNWSSQGQTLWYAGCQATGKSLAVSVTAPTPSTAALSDGPGTSQPLVDLPPQAAVLHGGTRAVAAGVMLIGVLMIGVGAIAASARRERRHVVALSSDLSTYRKTAIRPHDSRQ